MAVSLALLCGVVLPLAAIHAQTTAATRTADAGALFLQAAKAIVVDSPASSALEYPAYPPMGDAWTTMAAQAWKANPKARDLARQARSSDRASWPGNEDLHWLGKCRNMANELVDAALYMHLQGQDAVAIELVRDNLHLARLIRKDAPTHNMVRPAVAAGIDAQGMERLLTIAAGVKLTADPADHQALQIPVARELIRELLDQQSSEDLLRQSLGADYDVMKADTDIAKWAETFSRGNAERTMAAMSLACQLFRAEKGRWPNSLDEITPAFLPRVPVDPWGDGTQTFGYVLIKGGLPDGSDRPLVYCRCWSPDGLFFRLDAPQYCFYVMDGSSKPTAAMRHGGQFRDVTRWVPAPAREGQPTTQPLQGTRVSLPLPSGRLDFCMAVNRGLVEPAVSNDEAARLIKELAQHGPDAIAKQHIAMAWFPLNDAKDARGNISGQWNQRPYLLASTDPKHTMLADEAGKRAWGLVRVSVAKDALNQPAVGFDFDKAGAERFGALTRSHIGGTLAVLIDGQVVSAPRINSVISNSGIITRSEMTGKEASDLVTRLQRGMPAVTGPASRPTGWEEFGPEVEILVPTAADDPNAGLLRLADGKLVIPPPEAAKQPFSAQWNDWAQRSGVDLTASNNGIFQGLMGFDMAAVPIGQKLFPGVAWASALRDLQGMLKPGSPALLSAAGTLPTHYAIQTRSGTLGIISILELTDNPKGMKIRYRLLRPEAAKGSAASRHESGPQYAGGATSRPVLPPSNTAHGQSQLNDAYGLADGQVVKRVQPPFVPARMSYWKTNDPRPPADHTPAPDQIVFLWNGQEVAHDRWGWGQMDRLSMVLQGVMGWTTGDFEGPADLLAKRLSGDWVVRAGATEQEKVAGLLPILQRDVDPAITISKQQIEREVIVVRGKFQYQPHADASGTNQVILYSDPYVADTGGGGGAGTLANFLTTMGNCAGMRVVDEVDAARPEMVSWHTLESCWLSQRPKAQDRSAKLDSLLKNVAAQTRLVFTREKRKAAVWVVGEAEKR